MKNNNNEDFKVNEFGVCVNTNILSFETKKIKSEIRTAFIDDGWYYSISVNTQTGGYSSPCMKYKTPYQIEADAINAGKEDIKKSSYCDDELIKEISKTDQLRFL